MKFGLREAVFIVLLLGIPVGAWWFVFRPNNARNEQMLKQIQAKQARLRELNRLTASVGDMRKEIEALEEAIRFFQSKLPSEKEMDKVMKGIWLLAEANRLTTKSIRQLDRRSGKSDLAEGTQYAEQPVSVVLEGDFMGFYSFLQALENQPRIMRIRELGLTRAKGQHGAVQADFTMSIFFERGSEGS